MRLLGLVDLYFLIMMIIQGCVVIFIDAPNFKRKDMLQVSRKARAIGIGLTVLTIFLYTIQKVI